MYINITRCIVTTFIKYYSTETESQPAHLTQTRIQSHPLPENPIYESISIARRREQQVRFKLI